MLGPRALREASAGLTDALSSGLPEKWARATKATGAHEGPARGRPGAVRLPSCTEPAAPGRTGWEATVPICCRAESHTGHIFARRHLQQRSVGCIYSPGHSPCPHSARELLSPSPEPPRAPCAGARTPLARLPTSIDPRGSTQGKHTHTHTHTCTHKQGSLCKQLLVKLKLNSAQILTFGGDTNSADIFTSFINGPDHSALYAELEETRAAEVPRPCPPPIWGSARVLPPLPGRCARWQSPPCDGDVGTRYRGAQRSQLGGPTAMGPAGCWSRAAPGKQSWVLSPWEGSRGAEK